MTAGLLLLKNRLQPNSSRHLMRHYVNTQQRSNTNFIRERTIGRSRCRLERIVKRGKTDYSPFYHSGSTGGITEYNLLLFSRENFAVHFRRLI